MAAGLRGKSQSLAKPAASLFPCRLIGASQITLPGVATEFYWAILTNRAFLLMSKFGYILWEDAVVPRTFDWRTAPADVPSYSGIAWTNPSKSSGMLPQYNPEDYEAHRSERLAV